MRHYLKGEVYFLLDLYIHGIPCFAVEVTRIRTHFLKTMDSTSQSEHTHQVPKLAAAL